MCRLMLHACPTRFDIAVLMLMINNLIFSVLTANISMSETDWILWETYTIYV